MSKKINYTIIKKPEFSTSFIINKIIDAEEMKAKFYISLSPDSPTVNYVKLQENDLLISKNDYINKIKDNIVEIRHIEPYGGDHIITVSKFQQIVDASDGYDIGDEIMFLARAEFKD
jgi:hypothetical protein